MEHQVINPEKNDLVVAQFEWAHHAIEFATNHAYLHLIVQLGWPFDNGGLYRIGRQDICGPFSPI